VKRPVGRPARVTEDAATASGLVNTLANTIELHGISGAARKVPCTEGTLRALERRHVFRPIRNSAGRRVLDRRHRSGAQSPASQSQRGREHARARELPPRSDLFARHTLVDAIRIS
jgi:hypothetical protein